ncbi:MAG: hypothetical protein JWO81_2759 [Alphaproteobacteria bacterium]|nr:hypothetical protein [Alphaproteobacteria bacterium]
MIKHTNRLIPLVAIATLGLGYAAPAYAQATRTWVSGVGDDANPCSRTAPCKTFAGAISKTAAGGEINCIDPGGFGAVTITKALTIDCHYTEGGVLAGGNGIVVNAGATDEVVLRGLDIFGVTPPSNGVRFIAGGALLIEDCVIRRFNAANSFGISFQPSAASKLFVTNTMITQNGNGATGGGILVQPTGAAGSARVQLVNVNVLSNANSGFRLDTTGNTAPAGVSVVLDQSSFSGNADGIFVNTPVGTTAAVVLLTNSDVANNSATGISAAGAVTRIRVGNTSIHGNTTGLSFGGSGIINTYGDNRLNGNGTDGLFTAPAIAKQ